MLESVTQCSDNIFENFETTVVCVCSLRAFAVFVLYEQQSVTSMSEIVSSSDPTVELIDRAAEIKSWLGSIFQQKFTQDLLVCLKDGSILCDLCNIVWPRAIPVVHRIPNDPYFNMRNITAFVRCLRDRGFQEDECPTVADIAELPQLSKVVLCLEKLKDLCRIPVVDGDSKATQPPSTEFIANAKRFQEEVESVQDHNRLREQVRVRCVPAAADSA